MTAPSAAAFLMQVRISFQYPFAIKNAFREWLPEGVDSVLTFGDPAVLAFQL